MITIQSGTPKQFVTAPPSGNIDPHGIPDGLTQKGGSRVILTTRDPQHHTTAWGDEVTTCRVRTIGTMDIRYGNVSTVSRRAGTAYPVRYVAGDRYWDLSKGPEVIKREREELARKADYRARCRHERIIAAKTRDPSTVHENQSGLSAFEDMTQADVDPAATSSTDDRLSGLPTYLTDDDWATTDLDDHDPGKYSGASTCNHCGVEDPWFAPLETGLDGIRPGSHVDGNPDYDHCDPESVDVKRCDCCRCPRCSGLSVSHRQTMSPSFRCNNPRCELEFEHPVEYPDRDDDHRSKLYWRCKDCGSATKAPFFGIPEELL